MTTNRIESLDAALIRPGRVDLQVAFKHPSEADIRNLFVTIYQSPSDSTAIKEGQKTEQSLQPTMPKHTSKIGELAEEFALILPEGKFSFAAIQGYLLQYKQDPRAAVTNAAAWVAASSATG